MATIFARHDVEDFDAWLEAYNDFDAERRSMGVTGHGVYRSDDRPNEVTVYHHFDTAEKAQAFATSHRFEEVMRAAGVLGIPNVWITTKVL